MKTPLRIGLQKGVPRKFIKEVHKTVLERVHHTLHYAPKEVINLQEFPLQSSSALKKA